MGPRVTARQTIMMILHVAHIYPARRHFIAPYEHERERAVH